MPVPLFSDQPLTVAPAGTTSQESYTDKIIGAWKTQADDSQVLYWQFNEDGTLKAGNTPGSHDITGNWSVSSFKTSSS